MTSCPTCGGPCREIPENATFDWKSFDSLVKGEVVAEGWMDQRTLDWWNRDPSRVAISVWRGTAKEAEGHDIPVLVIQKEDSVIQERTGR